MAIYGAGFPCAPLNPCQLWGAGLDYLSTGALACLSSGAGLGRWVWLSSWLALALALALVARSQRWRFLQISTRWRWLF